ncbi:MAG: GIY-YIG nuclease family protein [Candidatus Pacebacteria bacterium]|nr:GIY-YIG nuclease family protein [Candidatus Paceibacterota bacterium]
MIKFKFILKDNIPKLPKEAGVYIFKEKGKLLYIGKAANLKERVKNHFFQPNFWDKQFIDKVNKIGYFKTNSEIEALILEANLIKKYQPKYNIVWKDDKNYFFVGKTQEPFPQIFITHQPKLNSKSYILYSKFAGPFVDGKSLKETLKILRKVFPYRSCRFLPKRPCLWYHLDRCPAPCTLRSKILEVPKISEKLENEAKRNAASLFGILSGKESRVKEKLKREMKGASRSKDFEKAAKIRDKILAFEKVLSNSKIFNGGEIISQDNWQKTQNILQKILKTGRKINRIEAYDISNIQGKEATGSMVNFFAGKPDKNFYRRFRIKISGKPNDIAMIKEILFRRLNHSEWLYPDLILIDGGKAQLNAAQITIRSKQLTIPVIAIAKRQNELYIEGRERPLLLKTLPREIFNLILQLRDEAHRFAISYHKKLRFQNFLPHT